MCKKKSNGYGGQPPVFSKVLLTEILRGGNFIFIHSGIDIVDEQA